MVQNKNKGLNLFKINEYQILKLDSFPISMLFFTYEISYHLLNYEKSLKKYFSDHFKKAEFYCIQNILFFENDQINPVAFLHPLRVT